MMTMMRMIRVGRKTRVRILRGNGRVKRRILAKRRLGRGGEFGVVPIMISLDSACLHHHSMIV
jgi:hypothetical protein